MKSGAGEKSGGIVDLRSSSALPILPLHVGRPNIGDRTALLRRFDEILDRRWFTNNGPMVQEFEKGIADFVGVKHCIAVCNATIGLEVAIRALDLKGEVIVPAFTFVATAHALQWQQIRPVFCDVDAERHLIDPSSVERLITSKTTGILAVHLWGRPAPIESLQAIADSHGLQLLFDAAHAFGCSHNGRMVGSFGRCEVFSFHATKFLNSFEGGAVVTDDDELARKIRLMTNFGFTGYDAVDYIGTNGKMTEICAAMGLTSLEAIDEFIHVNRSNFETYRRCLVGVPGVRVLDYDGSESRNYQYVVVEIDESRAGVSRDSILNELHSEGVLARRYFYPGVHRMEPYRSLYPEVGLRLRVTETVCDQVLVLPTGTSVRESDISAICSAIRGVISAA